MLGYVSEVCKNMKREEENLSEMILNYLRKHPDAGDTLEGITMWWLKKERIDATVDEVADVLREMVTKGVVTCHQTKTGQTFYRIKEEKR